MSDKRRFHRFLALLEVRVLPGDRIPADLRLSTLDISLGGARCVSSHPLDRDLPVKMTFTLVGGGLATPLSIDVDAVVRRCTTDPAAPPHRRHEVAIEFARLDPQDRKRLQDYLNQL